MKLLYASLYTLTSSATDCAPVYIRVSGDGSILRVTLEERYSGNSNVKNYDITYNGVTQRTPTPISGAHLKGYIYSFDFEYDDSVKSISIKSPKSDTWFDLFYNTVLVDAKTFTVSWNGTANEPSRVSGYIKSKTGAFSNSTNVLDIGINKPTSYDARIMRLNAYYYNSTLSTANMQTHEIAENVPYEQEYTYTGIKYASGRVLWYKIMIGFYDGVDPSTEPENCVEYLELTSPIYIGFASSQVPPPLHLTYLSPTAGGKNKITWELSEADVSLTVTQTELERSTNGGSTWTKIYKDAGTSFTDTIGSDWDSVMYRARTYSGSTASNYLTGEAVPITKTNLFIGVGGIPVAVSGLYLGMDGLKQISPIMYVGS